MKNNRLLLLSVVFGVVIFTMAFLNNYTLFVTKKEPTEKPIKPIKPSTDQECVLQACHGLDDSCGFNGPEMCDLMYVAGDKCRDFVECEVQAGDCATIYTPEFEACKTCVEDCRAQHPDNDLEFLECEGRC